MSKIDGPRLGYLDGIRGWAALSVVMYHLLPTFLMPPSAAADNALLLAPFNGSLAVYVFFVVSGFALSTGFIAKGDRRLIASLALRRYPRLMLPIAASCLVSFILMSSGAVHIGTLAEILGRTNWPHYALQFDPSFSHLVRFVLWDVFFAYDPKTSFNPPLWTMSVELAGSALVFLLLAVFGRSKARWIAYGAAMATSAYSDSPMVAFMLGVLLAEAARRNSAADSVIFKVVGMAVALAAIVAASTWTGVNRHPAVISFLGAAVVGGVAMSAALQRQMSARISRWLGHLSFPLYLIHVPLLATASSSFSLWILEKGATVGEVATITTLLSVPVALTAAYLFSPVEGLAIRFSAAVARIVIPESGSAPQVATDHR